jgi:magnesium-transporting ATPase (P-type)
VTLLETGFRLYCKGAAEVVLQNCSHVMKDDGTTMAISGESSVQLNGIIADWASQVDICRSCA